MERYNIIYKTTNLITGKSYIGSHSTNRIDDGYLGSGSRILSSIKKYGRKNFKREIIKYCDSIIEARLLEEKFIKEYNTLSPKGYNISETGGMGLYGGTHSLETREKLRKSHTGRKRDFSEDHKKRLSESSKNWHETIGMSKDTKEKISSKLRGKKHSDESIENYKRGNANKNLGRNPSPETISKIKKKLEGRFITPEWKDRISEGSRNSRVVCEFCGKEIPLNVYNRVHGKKCKSRDV